MMMKDARRCRRRACGSGAAGANLMRLADALLPPARAARGGEGRLGAKPRAGWGVVGLGAMRRLGRGRRGRASRPRVRSPTASPAQAAPHPARPNGRVGPPRHSLREREAGRYRARMPKPPKPDRSDPRTPRARALRREMTEAERRLWRGLRTLPLEETHWRRQAPVGGYVVDFACHGLRLALEVDGAQH